MSLFYSIAYASTAADQVTARILAPIIQNVVKPLFEVLMAVAVFIFIWGVAQLIINKDDASVRSTAGMHILWGVVGFFIIFGVFGIIRVVADTLGVSVPLFS